ncbi:MAG TPA: 1-acyl-sn-glycerol-3-phosphate acyltransferase [Gammaproteobacteria bacterium]|nr:1-acyl-sn-glycerol-3-phosphate acyltransferase [Gammaproteobacteria bacterium]
MNDYLPLLGLLVAAGTLLMWFLCRAWRACGEANGVDWGSSLNNHIVGCIALFCRYVHHFQYQPIPLPAEGGALVVANHISGLDPFLLIVASPRPLRFLIAREEYERFGLRWLFRRGRCIPVDRDRNPERALREALRALEAGDVVALFPQGRIHLESDGPRKLKGGVVRLAHKSGCPIYPVRVDDVRGAGHTVRGVLFPSEAKLRVAPVLHCEDMDHATCLDILAARLALDSALPDNPPEQAKLP